MAEPTSTGTESGTEPVRELDRIREELSHIGNGGEQLVGTFLALNIPGLPVARLGTTCFRIWCAHHGRELGVPSDSDSYPFFVREGDAWRIDLSEVFCPDGERTAARAELAGAGMDDEAVAEYSLCVNSWLILEVPDDDIQPVVVSLPKGAHRLPL